VSSVRDELLFEQADLARAIATPQSFIERTARRLIVQLLGKIKIGTLYIEEAGTQLQFGQPLESSSIVAHIRVQRSSVYRDILLRGSIGSGEAYMQGAWSSPDLTQVVRLMVANMDTLDDMDGRQFSSRKFFTALSKLTLRGLHAVRSNTRSGARKNIAAHYDLGNSFYALFLDSSMMYSAAIFPDKESSLEQASLYKIDRICKKLQLCADDHLLEIGTGWGGLAIYAAKNFGCKVTTTTISREQYEFAQQRIAEAGLSDRIELLLCDYRDLHGRFDKLVSVEMIEAVGHDYYRAYFEQCASLLKPEGLMLIQAITIADQRYDSARREVDFIQRYIFPGGCLPSIEVIAQHVARHTDLNIVGIEDITQHYARTLRAWYERFMGRISEVREQGFDETFIRMWQFYFCYCEGGFRERSIGAQQFLFAKPRCRLEPLLGAI
jgi:cyclopropane-fatty-acyl-phospholipid synthase